jgi:nucleoside-diphosphate-sugar epimerase
MHCAVTGARGFVGRALVPALERRGWQVQRWDRGDGFELGSADGARWRERLEGVDAVVHLAARVHQLHETGSAALERYLRINRDGTAQLAAAALAAGVGKFVLLSTAKVFGEGDDGPYTAASPARPQDAYAISKWQAEQALAQFAQNSGMDAITIRPPLVYGPGVGGNFLRLLRVAGWRVPLPLAAVANRRDMIAVQNLTDLIALALEHPAAAGKTWLCSDGEPYSLAAVIAAMRAAAGGSARLFPAPATWLNRAGRLALGAAAAERLFGNFELDIGATRQALGWSPRVSMRDTLRDMLAEAV